MTDLRKPLKKLDPNTLPWLNQKLAANGGLGCTTCPYMGEDACLAAVDSVMNNLTASK